MISTFKSVCYFILALFLVTAGLDGVRKAQASHFAAADLYVDYIGTSQTELKYRVTLVVYKACEYTSFWNANLSPSEPITVTSSCGTFPGFSVDTTGNNTNDTLDQLCPNFAPINACRVAGSPWPAFVKYLYTKEVTLPSQCSDWTFTWSSGSRNGGITNLCNPASQNITVTAVLNNQIRYNNSTPRFTVDPVPYFCINQPNVFFNNPLDPNADSIRVLNNNPKGCTSGCNGNPCGPNGEIPYQAGFSLTHPFAANDNYNVNTLSGTATFTPTGTGKYVVAFRCYEYDKVSKALMGYVERDVQVSVLNCNAGAPSIDSVPRNVVGGKFDSVGGNILVTCPAAATSFDIHANSNSLSNAVYMTASVQALGGAPPPSGAGPIITVSNQGGSSPITNVSWTPGLADVGDYQIIVEAKDSTCNNGQPIIFRSYLTMLVKVVNGIRTSEDRFGYCGLNGDPIQLFTDGISSLTYQWTKLDGTTGGINTPTSQNPWVTTNTTTSYVVYTPDLPPGCKVRDTVTIFVDESNDITITPASTPDAPYVMCRPGYLQLSATTTGPRPVANLACGTLNPVTCTQQDSITVGTGLTSSTVYTPFYGTYPTARMQFIYTAAELRANGLKSGTIRKLAFNVPGVPSSAQYSNFKISLKCSNKASFYTGESLESGMTLVYTAPANFAPVTGWNNFVFDYPYNWDSTQGLIVEVCFANTAYATSTAVQFTQTPFTSMLRYYYGSGNMCNSTTLNYNVAYAYRPNIKFNYCRAGDGEFQYTWKPGTFLSDSSSSQPLAYIAKTAKYVVYTVGRSGCLVRDSFMVYVPKHNYGLGFTDTSICAGESVLLDAKPAKTYTWYENGWNTPTTLSCANCQRPLATPTGDTRYFMVAADSVGCSDTFSVFVEVRPLPVVSIIEGDTLLIKYGTTVPLHANGADIYHWSPVTGLSVPTGPIVMASPEEPTTYVVSGLAENGCQSKDSIRINVDYKNNLFVPSAFSPNSDGKNDIFKVANLNVQRLIEFRVFNRWGQEIFSSTDNRRGWDGTWKNVPQDAGIYHYIIRVAFPDGITDTYKGDVTLIR